MIKNQPDWLVFISRKMEGAHRLTISNSNKKIKMIISFYIFIRKRV